MKQRIWILLPLLLACAGFFRCGGGGAGSALADGKTWSPPERISDNVTELHYPAVAGKRFSEIERIGLETEQMEELREEWKREKAGVPALRSGMGGMHGH